MQKYMEQVYNTSNVDPQKKKLLENNYMRFVTREGVLLDDELWVHPDTITAHKNGTQNTKYIFVFTEKYLNDWSSTQSMKRFKKLAKTHIKFLDSVDVL